MSGQSTPNETRILRGAENFMVELTKLHLAAAGTLSGVPLEGITVSDLRTAGTLVQSRHPNLRAKIQFNSDGNIMEFGPSDPDKIEIAVINDGKLVHMDGDSPSPAWLENNDMGLSWVMRNGPADYSFRIAWVVDQAQLMVGMHHVFSDGRGALRVLTDLFEALYQVLNDCVGDWKPRDPICVLERIAPPPVLAKMLLSWPCRPCLMKLVAWAFTAGGYPNALIEGLLDDVECPFPSPIWRLDALSSDETTNFISACKERNVTVGSALIAACHFAMHKHMVLRRNCRLKDKNDIMIGFSADMRQRVSPPATLNDVALGVNIQQIFLDGEDDSSIWSNAHAAGTKVQAALDAAFMRVFSYLVDKPCIADEMASAGVDWKIHGGTDVPLAVANIGAWHVEKQGEMELSNLIVLNNAGLANAAITFYFVTDSKGQMTLSLLGQSPAVGVETCEAVLRDFRELVIAMSANDVVLGDYTASEKVL